MNGQRGEEAFAVRFTGWVTDGCTSSSSSSSNDSKRRLKRSIHIQPGCLPMPYASSHATMPVWGQCVVSTSRCSDTALQVDVGGGRALQGARPTPLTVNHDHPRVPLRAQVQRSTVSWRPPQITLRHQRAPARRHEAAGARCTSKLTVKSAMVAGLCLHAPAWAGLGWMERR